MKHIKLFLLLTVVSFWSCQDLEEPALGDFPEDANPPGGPLKFYQAFDGATTNVLMNAVDSIKANFPSQNPFTTIDGIKGKAVQGGSNQYIKFGSFNDWAASSSVTISFWSKGGSQTVGNEGGNSPEHVISFPAKDGHPHWSGSIMMLFIESNATGCQVKWMVVDKNRNDSWFTWEGGDAIPGVLDNQWHHFVLRYDAATSNANLYVDGVKNSITRTWGSHGPLNLDAGFIREARVGKGPRDNGGNDWQSGSLQRGLDQLRLYGTALTDAEIQKLFTDKK
jgi:hypothetical protein